MVPEEAQDPTSPDGGDIETEDRKFSLGLYGQNIFDEVYKTEGQEFSSIGSIRTVYYGQPMTWYVRGTVRF